MQIFNYNSFINEELHDDRIDFNIFDKSMIEDSLQELEDEFGYELRVYLCWNLKERYTYLISDSGEFINRKRIAESISRLSQLGLSDYICPMFDIIINIPDGFREKSKLFNTLSRAEEKLTNYSFSFTQDDRNYQLTIIDKKRYKIS